MSDQDFSALVASWLVPDWPAPPHVRAYVSTRGAPLSYGPYGAFNTADHVGDTLEHVQASRDRFAAHFGFKKTGSTKTDFANTPIWLDQVHGTQVVVAAPDTPRQAADAVTTQQVGLPITIHTADCLPVFICNRAGTQVAIAHAGWRGLAAGVIENTVSTFSENPADLLVWLGPAIGPDQFEVGSDVRDGFTRQSPEHALAFQPSPFTPDGSHWLCNIYLLARQRLARLGIVHAFGGQYCTVSDSRFFSYRRDKMTGRMLSVIWIDNC